MLDGYAIYLPRRQQVTERSETPVGIKITKDGNILIQTISQEKVLRNAVDMIRQGKATLWKNNFQGLYADLQIYLGNHAAGLAGDANGLGTAKRDTLNTFFGQLTNAQRDANPVLQGISMSAARKAGAFTSRRLDRISRMQVLSTTFKADYIYDAGIVCEECERRFAPWDDYADELFLKSWDKFDPIQVSGRVVAHTREPVDYSLLKLFFMSLLWRASVSTHTMFAKVDLGKLEAPLRDAIRGSDPGTADFFGVVLQAFDAEEVGLLDPHPEQFDGLQYYRFYLGRLIAYIKVDSSPMGEPFSSVALAPNRALVVMTKSFLTSPERRIMQSLVQADRAKAGRRGRDAAGL